MSSTTLTLQSSKMETAHACPSYTLFWDAYQRLCGKMKKKERRAFEIHRLYNAFKRYASNKKKADRYWPELWLTYRKDVLLKRSLHEPSSTAGAPYTEDSTLSIEQSSETSAEQPVDIEPAEERAKTVAQLAASVHNLVENQRTRNDATFRIWTSLSDDVRSLLHNQRTLIEAVHKLEEHQRGLKEHQRTFEKWICDEQDLRRSHMLFSQQALSECITAARQPNVERMRQLAEVTERHFDDKYTSMAPFPSPAPSSSSLAVETNYRNITSAPPPSLSSLSFSLQPDMSPSQSLTLTESQGLRFTRGSLCELFSQPTLASSPSMLTPSFTMPSPSFVSLSPEVPQPEPTPRNCDANKRRRVEL